MLSTWMFPHRRRDRSRRTATKHSSPLRLESLESRDLLAVAVVNAGQEIRQVNDHVLGVNLAWWDSNLNTTQTRQLVQAAGLTMFRFPGGSSSDTWHFNAPPSYNGQGTSPSMARFIASVGGAGMVTLDYGSGSPQEAAALLAYLNGATGNTTLIGSGAVWNTATSTWVQQDWKTAGYWAGLRAAAPLGQDDGLNFLRLGRTAPFGFHYLEVGNEIYGSWETDNHGQGGDVGKAHDPATYVAFTKQFADYAAKIDPTISIGQVTGSISYDNNWTPNVLFQDAKQGVTPGFLSDHVYVQAPGSESDSTLLLNTVSSATAGGSGSPDNWTLRAAGYRNLLKQHLGTSATNVELLATEFNSVYSNPGKQSTSLVNGLYLADSLGIILQTEYNAADVWDLRNGWDAANNNAAGLYGWRHGGDYGLLGGGGTAPSTGTYVPYPTYFAEQLLSKMVHTGDSVVKASSNDPNLTVYAVKQATGHLGLLVINKSASADLTGQFQITGFAPSSQAQLRQYGKAQDTAQGQTTDGHSALANIPANLSLNGPNFSYTFPSYSMTVMELAPSSAPTQFAVSAPATATAGSPFIVSVTAQDGSGHAATTYSGTVQLTSTDGQAVLPASATLTNGYGTFLVTLKTASGTPWTVKAKDTSNPAITGTSGSILVSPGAASYFTVSVPGTSTTGAPVNVTVTAYDPLGNVATGYKGRVHFDSSDAGAALPTDSTMTAGVGTFSVTLTTAGNQTITATDNLSTNPTITGNSSSITTRGLTVTSFTPTATGFTADFSKPFVPGDLSLYGAGLYTVPDVTLVGSHVGALTGSLLIDSTYMSVTFNATVNGLSLLNGGSPVLPDDTYTVTLVSGSGTNGFRDALGAGLDGSNSGGHANYTTTFTTHYQANATPVLGIPDFARGPDGTHPVRVPNDTGHGIPITLYNAAKVTDVTFTLIYNPMLLTLAGGFGGADSDATDPDGSFTQLLTPNAYGHATFQFHDATAQSGTVVLGDIKAMVPDSAADNYKAKELLHVYNIVINQGGITGAVSAAAVHLNAYFGDVTGNGSIDGLDVATASNVAQGKDSGFAAYALLDPAVVGDVALDYSVDAGGVSDLAAFTVRLPTPVIPTIPTGLIIIPRGADPTLSLGAPRKQGDGSISPGLLVSSSPGPFFTVPVLLDRPHPEGSTGMTEAILALTYDPSVLSVSASDITLGSIPSLGAGWQLHSVIDQATGQIGITLYSTTPISAAQAGSLVNIAFHLQPGERRGVSPPWPAAVQLVSSVLLDGRQFTTQVDDAQGQFVLGPALDRLGVYTGVVHRKERGNRLR